MRCLYPIVFGPSREGSKFRYPEKFGFKGDCFPCGKCRNCRLHLIKQWVVRCLLEETMHEHSCFVNLTYRDKDLPVGNSLRRSDLSGFLKRLRAGLDYHYPGVQIRFYASGEYGSKNGRPHYHVLIFGFDFPDKYRWRKSDSGYPTYRSEFLEKYWKFGHCEIGTVTEFSARYVAKYISKKRNGEAAKSYKGRSPEFSLSSMRPGIGFDWYQQNKSWLWKEDLIRIGGRSYRPPQYFQKLFKAEDPKGYEAYLSGRDLRRLAVPLKAEELEECESTDEAGNDEN